MQLKSAVSGIISLALYATPTLRAQAPAAPPSSDGTTATAKAPAPFTQGKLEAMVAPVALYPDALRSQMLMAAAAVAKIGAYDPGLGWSKAR